MLQFGIDVGGTFTDLVIYDQTTRRFHVEKVPTTKNVEDGIVTALGPYREEMNRALFVYHATTIATNALLTRKGLGRTALLTTRGFRDVIEIGRQRRPEPYNLKTERPVALVNRRDRYVVGERMLPDGSEDEPLDENDLRRTIGKIRRSNYDSLAICFLNSYANPAHERMARVLCRQMGFEGHIDISSEVDPEYREYERTSTTVVNSALTSIASRYLLSLEEKLRHKRFRGPVYVMNSDGTAATIAQAIRRPISMIESGPAAGVLASAALAERLGLKKVISFDMGGTTAKTATIVNGKPDLAYEFEAAGKNYHGRSLKGSGYPVRRPFIDLAEVSAGGGTIAWIDDTGNLKVGPQSAGADPGPAAYANGGDKATVTDANIVIGRINPSQLLGGRLKIHYELAVKAIKQLGRKLGTTVEETARNILRIANNNMERALFLVTVERGQDARQYSLVAFGGAGPLHACELAEGLQINKIIVPLHPGLFSAIGLLTAELSRKFSQPILKTLPFSIERSFKELRKHAQKSLTQEGFSEYIAKEHVDLRYQGQAYEITVPYNKRNTNLITLFKREHVKRYGYASTDSVEAVNIRLQALIPTPKLRLATKKPRHPIFSRVESARRVLLPDGASRMIPVYTREKLAIGAHGKGAAIVEEYDSTTMIGKDWLWRVDQYDNIRLTLQ
ncbi:MAG TPA: hydantoinase/oxoprolinase family protein [Candidatus Bathyarchaeia archaeon]|nr:hydantoinase/oxoprolinase family protein [Candidatus Bathyarchaeia archaeon]